MHFRLGAYITTVIKEENEKACAHPEMGRTSISEPFLIGLCGFLILAAESVQRRIAWGGEPGGALTAWTFRAC
jgi:hypothetical protein